MSKLELTYWEAVNLIEQVIHELPDQGETIIRKPNCMFDWKTLEPQDIVAMMMVKAGFDPREIQTNQEMWEANGKHLWLTGYNAFFVSDALWGGPNFKTNVYLSDLIKRMDRGYTAARAHRLAMKWADRFQAEQDLLLPHLSDRW